MQHKNGRKGSLQHTFASQLVMAGVELTKVKELLGYKAFTMLPATLALFPLIKLKL